MRAFVNNWHYVSLALAAITAVLAVILPFDATQSCILAAIAILFLHFFEEFGFPGGFPLVGIKVMMGSDDMDKRNWHCNNLSSLFGNWGFLLAIYVLALLLPGVRFLTLSAMMFLFAEVLMHFVIFPARLRWAYNPGMVSTLGLLGVGLVYFLTVFDPAVFAWYEYALAVVWFVAVFLFCFRSKLYWTLGDKPGFDLSDRSAFGMKMPK